MYKINKRLKDKYFDIVTLPRMRISFIKKRLKLRFNIGDTLVVFPYGKGTIVDIFVCFNSCNVSIYYVLQDINKIRILFSEDDLLKGVIYEKE